MVEFLELVPLSRGDRSTSLDLPPLRAASVLVARAPERTQREARQQPRAPSQPMPCALMHAMPGLDGLVHIGALRG